MEIDQPVQDEKESIKAILFNKPGSLASEKESSTKPRTVETIPKCNIHVRNFSYQLFCRCNFL